MRVALLAVVMAVTALVSAVPAGAASSTSLGLSPSRNPAPVGQPVTLTATVNPVPDGGTVLFSDRGEVMPGCAEVPVDTTTGAATCARTYTQTGNHAMSASYSGTA